MAAQFQCDIDCELERAIAISLVEPIAVDLKELAEYFPL